MPSKRKSAAKPRRSSDAGKGDSARISGHFQGNIVAAGALHIAQGAHCKANIRAADLRVDGRFEGTAAARGGLQIGNNASCKGSFNAATLKVDGSVKGQVHVHDRMDLSSSAQMEGEIVANRLIVSDGASFAGRCTIGRFASKSARKAA